MSDPVAKGLTPLQLRILASLPSTEPPWVLTGGGALVGFHLNHRTTRDLDLFWHGRMELGDSRDACIRGLRAHGLYVRSNQRDQSFERLTVSDGRETVQVDLVAEPVPTIEAPMEATVESLTILVDTPHEILVNKLCALLGRSELRDLLDVMALTDQGEDFGRAVRDAPEKDAGFSPLSLAWVLRGLPIAALADAAGLDSSETARMATLRDTLVERLVSETKPE